MALNSINTNIAAYYAQQNIGRSSQMASGSIARLSSGNRIVRASDDVAAMSAGTSLRTNVTTLKMALINTSQGSSLLQVADGALGQITDILQRQKAISVQAGSGTLTSAERGFLNQEFTNLSEEIDRLVTQTNFNGVALLNGSTSQTTRVVDDTSGAGQAVGAITFNINNTGVQTVILNGVTFTGATANAAATFIVGPSITDTVDNLVSVLNASTNTAISSATYSRSGNSLVITSKAGGLGAEDYIIGDGAQIGTWGASANNAVSVSGKNGGSFLTAFTTKLGAANVTDSATAAAASATVPFKTGDTLKAKIGGGAVSTLATMTTGESLTDLVNEVNSGTGTHGFKAFISGNSGDYEIILYHSNPDFDNEGTAGNGGDITVTASANTLNKLGVAVTASTNTNTVHIKSYGLASTDHVGIGAGDTVGIGTIGNSVLTAQDQSKSKVELLFPEIAPAALNTTLVPTNPTAMAIRIGDAALAPEQAIFTFTTQSKTQAASTEIAVGDTLTETIDNAVEVINKFYGTGMNNFDLDQIRAYRDGNKLVFESVNYGDTVHLDNGGGVVTPVSVSLANAIAGASLTSGGTLNSGNTTGVSARGITNEAFTGTISGFKAIYTGTNDTVTMTVTIGDHLYTANNIDTTPQIGTQIRFTSSDGGGYFDIQQADNQGSAVASQADADTYAARIEAAFSSLTFYQSRTVSSYTGTSPIVTDNAVTGSLLGSSVKMQMVDFTDAKIEDIQVEAPTGSTAHGTITFTVNGELYKGSNTLTGQLGAQQTYRFTSASDVNKYLDFTTGLSTIDFSTDAKAASFEQALKEAFGVGEGDAALQFQVGVTTTDTLQVSLEDASTDSLFGGEVLNVLTAVDAAHASNVIDDALHVVTSVRAEVGALQSRFAFASANIESSIQNQDAARGVLLDTDIASESTAYATAQVQLQAGIAVLAQANLLPQNLLKLIG